MGKLKGKRNNRKNRLNPLSKKRDTEKENNRDETVKQQKVLPVIERLKSSVPNEKAMAISAIVLLCEDAKMRKLLIKEGIISLVMERCLNDSNEEIVVDAFGLLRNLTLEEGYDVAMHLWRSNIWESIEASLLRIKSSFEYLENNPPKDETRPKVKTQLDPKIQLLYDFTENIMALIVALASASDDLLEKIFQRVDNATALAVDIINWNIPKIRTTFSLLNSLLEFIFEFSSASSAFISSLVSSTSFDLAKLRNFGSLAAFGENILGKVYIEGISFHIEETTHTEEDKNAVSFSILSSLLADVTTIDLARDIAILNPEDNASNPIQGNINRTEKDNSADLYTHQLEKLQAKADIQAIETGVDIMSSVWEYLSLKDEFGNSTVLNPDITSLILNTAFPCLLELLKSEIERNMKLEILDKVLASVNNLCWLFISLDTIPVPWYESLILLWNMMMSILNRNDDLSIQKDALNVSWAIVKSLGAEVDQELDTSIIGKLISKCNGLRDGDNQSNLDALSTTNHFILAAVGFLGSIAQIANNADITGEISDFLMLMAENCLKNPDQNDTIKEIAIECLNFIYDIFADKSFSYDYELFVKKDYVHKLQHLEPHMKVTYKSIDKNRHPYLKLKAEETWLNLNRFIEYKKSEYNI